MKSETSFFQLSWPILVESTLYYLIVFIDALILSRVSTEAAAAVGACTFVISMLLSVIVGFAQGASICISHRIGQKNPEEAVDIAVSSMIINIIIGIVLGLSVHLLRYEIPVWFGLTGQAVQDGMIFLSVVGGTTILWSFLISASYALKSYGFTKYSMYAAIIVNIANTVLAWSAVEGYFGLPKMGVAGVAWSTFIARVIGICFIAYFWLKVVRFKFSLPYLFKVTKKHFHEICAYGVPISFEPLSYQGSQLIITGIIGQLGITALAIRTYVWAIINFNTVVVTALAQSTQILVGRFYGAYKFKEAEKEFSRNLNYSLISALFMVTVVYVLGKPIMGLFTTDAELIQISVTLFSIGYIMEPGRTSNIITGGALRAVGDPKYPLYVGLIFMWGISIPVAWFFGIYLKLGIIGIWYGLAVDELIRGYLNYRRFKKKKWAIKSLEDSHIKLEQSHT